MRPEVRYLEKRYNLNNEPFFRERQNGAGALRPGDWWQSSAICMVEHFDRLGKPERTQMYVNSQPLRKLLNHVLYDRAGDNEDPKLLSPFWQLFYDYSEINKTGEELFLGDEEAMAHLHVLIRWISAHFADEIRAYALCILHERKTIPYEHLWTLFPPNGIVIKSPFGKVSAFRVDHVEYSEGSDVEPPGFKLFLGETATDMLIPKYMAGGGEDIPVSKLDVQPLFIHENEEDLRRDLIRRGRIFEKFIGKNFYAKYKGFATRCTMIDFRNYRLFARHDRFRIKKPILDLSMRGRLPRDQLSDDMALITSPTVCGFSFTANAFVELYIEDLSPFKRSREPFDNLILEPSIKTTLRALAQEHSNRCSGIGHAERGKEQGLICLLHGPAGVGKTSTAESVADLVERPLYKVSASDLGATKDVLERNLNVIIVLASSWKAVLVIEDADAFLEHQTSLSFERNLMVNTFLRLLEKFHGILFLTTSRVNAIDHAFMSRIHLPIYYTDHSRDSRLNLWRKFYNNMASPSEPVEDNEFQPLAVHSLNGRQIKNIVNAAECVAAHHQISVGPSVIGTVANIHVRFEQSLGREASHRRGLTQGG
ncbi:P-loop containing nucleoside triphosphate hydrolase protein [Xylaria cf. heliscus]|nr:P-loop containing nucleoside triphosphate hydrolase protein [Xylaria cf. heliscus]